MFSGPLALLGAATLTLVTLQAPATAQESPPAAQQRAQEPSRKATAVGKGGAVTSVDPYASRIGLQVLKNGGNAVDAAVATAAALGVTEPYSAGIGGGGYFVYYDAKSKRVKTLDGRETAPAAMKHDAFINPATGQPYTFTPDLVTSGVSVGVPGTPATWQAALDRWGSMSLADVLAPASNLARSGFKVDKTFNQQTDDNAERFNTFTSTRQLFLRHGKAPKVGSVFRNPDLADTYDLLAERGIRAFYRGDLARELAKTVRKPPVSGRTDLPVPKGKMRPKDLAKYDVVQHRPTHVSYRGLDVYGMPPSSSGGTTVGEALNILERYDLKSLTPAQVQHLVIEAAHLAFADRAKYVGYQSGVPVDTLLSDTYAAERACKINPLLAFVPPVAAGNVAASDGSCATPNSKGVVAPDTEGVSTTNLTVTDKRGNVVEYTLTIEQTGGSGIVVPGRGFLLNNELTDFSTVYDPADPNRIEPGKRPRSSMSPTIVLQQQEAGPRARVARRLDDHHHGARDPGQPARPRDVTGRRRRGAAGGAEQHDSCEGRAGLPRPLPGGADRARSCADAGRCGRHLRCRDRRGDSDRVRPERPAHGRRRAHPSRRGSGDGGQAEIEMRRALR